MTDPPVDLGRLGVWSHLDSLSIEQARDYARRVDELGFGTLWVPETVGREPFTLLGLLAGETFEVRLGTSIVSIWGHDAQTARMAALTLSEATGGRFVLGLGVSHPHLAERLRGHTFDRPLTRMREFLAAYRSAVYKGPIGEEPAEPPILLAALRERMLGLAGSEADGAFPYLVTPERVAWTRVVLDTSAGEAGRGRSPALAVSMPAVLETDAAAARSAARAYLAPYLRTPAYQASWTAQGFAEADWEKPGTDRLVDAMVAWGDAEALHARIGELVGAGADHVAVIPLSPDGATENLRVLEALATV
ncbi:MAG TPA: TIGR03620 family F420-dependent LLM class oxidoreductase [Candidatus Dormibacteraeota bacterium]|nr:TIGR03620 family F420-dependent LLM class oxidoreductase [Candidatus Dormibacteraeota bacterium]